MKRPLSLLLSLSFCFVCLPPALASWGEKYGSVHFNSGEPDFGMLPRRGVAQEGRDKRPNIGIGGSYSDIHIELSKDRDLEREGNIMRRRAAFQETLSLAVAAGKWEQARALIAQEAAALGWTGGLRDRDEVLGRYLALPRPVTDRLTQRLRSYFYAMRLAEGLKAGYAEACRVFQVVYRDPASGFLREHAMYQIGALCLQKDDELGAIQVFQTFLEDFPRSPKVPAVLLMTARAGLLHSADPEVGIRAVKRLQKEFPGHRLTSAAPGLEARYLYITGRKEEATHIYLELADTSSLETIRKDLPVETRQRLGARFLAAYLYGLERAETYAVFAQALNAVDREMEELTTEGAQEFVARLFREPALAAPYFYYRLYHTDTFVDYPNDIHSEEGRKDIQRRVRARTNLLSLAERIAQLPSAKLPTNVQVRLAEVQYQLGHYGEAERWANRVLALGPNSGAQDRALYVRGAIRHKRKRYNSAIADFEHLLAECPNSTLRYTSREELALLYEATGQNGRALDQYFYLGYEEDIAYTLDVRMTTGEVTRYLAEHPNHPKRVLLTYSLGVRQLRDNNLSAARRTFLRLTPAEYQSCAADEDERFDDFYLHPIQVIDAMVELRQGVRRARTREARASAMYREASFYYKTNLILFYNRALWDGRRVFNFDVFWNRRAMTATDRRAIQRHMYQHEVYVRVIDLCREIANNYPETTSAPLALYRGACAAEHLADLNQWWEAEDRMGRHLTQEATNLMSRLARRYPKHPLAHNARKYGMVFAEEEQETIQYLREALRDGSYEKARAY